MEWAPIGFQVVLTAIVGWMLLRVSKFLDRLTRQHEEHGRQMIAMNLEIVKLKGRVDSQDNTCKERLSALAEVRKSISGIQDALHVLDKNIVAIAAKMGINGFSTGGR